MTVLYAFSSIRFAMPSSPPADAHALHRLLQQGGDGDRQEKKNDKGGATIVGYRPEIKYAYRVAGRPRRSERIWFIRPSPDTQADAKKVVEKYPQGSDQQCFVDPKDEDFAVLERGFRPQMLIALFPLAFAIFGMAGMVSRVLRRVSTPDPARARASLSAGGNADPSRPERRGGVLPDRPVCGCLELDHLVHAQEVVKTWREGIGLLGMVLPSSSFHSH